ncbi:hypothetical protein FB45DRAFT_912917 [Roridomyces roridus]|uniref:Uncharacterized protein n=1 Tax=Roridomyces roridus TaxID=1738132 RepID=A0AAD7BWS2_9AGAR|nr:hypothetical protein FB45DRAFT_912917 [Roridomyces roridus]
MLFQPKRLSVTVNPYEPPSFFSSELTTESPVSPLPLPPRESTPSRRPVRFSQPPRSPAQDTPSPRSTKTRPKSYGGGLTPGTLELVLDFESRIAQLESRHNRISVELEETRDTLNNERAEHRSSHRFSTFSHARFSSDSSPANNSENAVDYERRLREELQDTLKKIRAQNATLARSVEEERSARTTAEEEVERLSAANSILFEHNKLLAGRDAALQEDITSLLTKSEEEERVRGVLEAELLLRTPLVSPMPECPPAVIGEPQGSLRTELVAIRDELHFTQGRLSTSERECASLKERISALQKQLVLSLDSSSQALEVERELRADIEQRAQRLVDENTDLKGRLGSLEELFFNGQAPDDWLKLCPTPGTGSDKEGKRRPVSGRFQRKMDSMRQDGHRHVLTARKLREHRKRRLAQAKAPKRRLIVSPEPFTIPKLVSRDAPVSRQSSCSTKVESPSASPTRGRNKRMSVIMAATLSRQSRSTAWSALKTNSSLFVNWIIPSIYSPF